MCILCYITCYVYVMLDKHVMLMLTLCYVTYCLLCYITCYVYIMLHNMLCLLCYINMLS